VNARRTGDTSAGGAPLAGASVVGVPVRGAPALVLERVARTFPCKVGAPVGLREVSAVVERGQIAALVGRNGSGKTTALRIAATLVRPTSGRALVYGRDVVREHDRVRGLLGVSIGSGRSFYWRLSAHHNLAFFGRLQGLRRARIAAEISRVAAELDLERYLDRPVRGLSQGTLARLSVARACLGEPELLLLDEPCASVDVRSRELLWGALERRVAAGHAVLLATHEEWVSRRCAPVVELR
jgi:ABC-type Na+ transport system ATPase subunit NatA